MQANQAVWKNKNLSIIERAKQMKALNQTGNVPSSLIKVVQDPVMGEGAQFSSPTSGNGSTFYDDGTTVSTEPMEVPPMEDFFPSRAGKGKR